MTALAAVRAGTKVGFVDCDADHLIDLASCEQAVTKKTKAIFAVHLVRLAATRRDAVLKAMTEQGIGVRAHLPGADSPSGRVQEP